MGEEKFTGIVLSLIKDSGIDELKNLLRFDKKIKILSDDDLKRLEDSINRIHDQLEFEKEIEGIEDSNIILYKTEIKESYLFDIGSSDPNESAVAQIVNLPDRLDSLEDKIELNLRNGTLCFDIDPTYITVDSKFLTKPQYDLILQVLNELKRANILLNNALNTYAQNYGLDYTSPSFDYTDPHQVNLLKQLEKK